MSKPTFTPEQAQTILEASLPQNVQIQKYVAVVPVTVNESVIAYDITILTSSGTEVRFYVNKFEEQAWMY